MHLSVLQLNCNGLRWKDNLFHFLSTHSYDALQLQEVAGTDTHVGALYATEDNFKALQTFLGDAYTGFFVKSDDILPQGYFGNATFIKSTIPILQQKTLWLHKRTHPFESDNTHYEKMSRTVLCLKIAPSFPLWLLNTHLTWGPDAKDTPTKLSQSLPLVDIVGSLQDPFILTGDFNVDNSSQIIKGLERYGRNLIKENHITNTLNPHTHRAQHLFPPGLAVDYIFTNPSLKVTKLRIIDGIDLSDHLGVEIEVEI